MEQVIRFSVSLPKDLLEAFDKQVQKRKYSSRSEFIRDLIRDKIVEDLWEDKDDGLIGVLSTVYDHHKNDLLAKKVKYEHDSEVQIVCTTHVHVDHNNCLETSVLIGPANKLIQFSNNIAGLKGIKFTKLTKIGVPEI